MSTPTDAPTSGPDESPGPERIGRYATTRVLGSGAFATVWLGRDEELDVPVAIKVLADNWARNHDVRARFVDEARILRRISDPRVIGVHDIGTLPDQRSYFVMDFADGGTVADRTGSLDRASALRLAIEIAQAVQVLHDHGVLHRDIKPSNLLLRHREGRPDRLMIADLGTAKALAEASGLTLSAGTPAYMAPEQAHGALPLDARADVYGVAAVTYALLVGRPPFVGEQGVADVAFRSPDRRPGSVGDAGLDAVLVAALAFDPDDRPGSAAELAEQIAERLTALAEHRSMSSEQSTVSRWDLARPESPPARPARATRPVEPVSTAETLTMPVVADPVPPAARPQPASVRPAPVGLGAGGLVAVAVIVFVLAALAVWFGLAQL